MAEEKNKNEKECPLCQVSEETLKILREKGRNDKPKDKPKNNGN